MSRLIGTAVQVRLICDMIRGSVYWLKIPTSVLQVLSMLPMLQVLQVLPMTDKFVNPAAADVLG